MNLDPADMLLSRRHARFEVDGGALVITDPGASNGTYLKVRGEAGLTGGMEFKLGGRRFRFDSDAFEEPIEEEPEQTLSYADDDVPS